MIDGATGHTTTVNVGPAPYQAAVNTVTNKIYVANSGGNTVTVIDGTNQSNQQRHCGQPSRWFGGQLGHQQDLRA